MRGRKPVSGLVKSLRGTNRKPAALPAPPTLETIESLRESPAHFTEEMRELWNHAVRVAGPFMLSRKDFAVLAAWVVAVHIHAKATEQLGREGVTLNGEPNPILRTIDKSASQILRASAELGFSPTARARMDLHSSSPLPQVNPFRELRA